MNEAKFAITLEDMLSPNAAKAKASIASLSTSLDKAKGQLAGYQSQLSLAKDIGDIEGYKKYSGLVDQSKRSIFEMTEKLGGAKTELAAGAGAAEGMAAALGPIGMAAGVATAGVAALVGITEKFVVKALEAVNAKQRLVAMFDAIGAGEGSGKKTLAMLGDLGSKLPQSGGELVGWTKKIQAMGVTDLSRVRSELVATASAAAIMNDPAAADAYLKIQEKVIHAIETGGKLKMADAKVSRTLHEAGIKYDDVAKRMGMTNVQLAAGLKAGTVDAKKFGDALRGIVTEKGKNSLEVMMNSLDVMKQKASKIFDRMFGFSEIDTKPLTDALRNLISLGDKGAPSAGLFKDGFVGAMNAVVKTIGYAITEATIFFLEIEVKGLEAYLAIRPIVKAFEQISKFAGVDILGSLTGGATSGAVSKVFGGGGGEAQEAGGGLAGKLLAGINVSLPMATALVTEMATSFANPGSLAAAEASGEAIGKSALKGMRKGVQANSPSVEAMKIGGFVSEGFGMGMVASSAPERAARTISGNALGGLAGGTSGLGGAAAANDTAATSNVFHISITAPEGVTDATQLSVIGLSTALERYQIGSGR